MKYLLLLSLLVFSAAAVPPHGFPELAHCDIKGTSLDPNIGGTVNFYRKGNTVVMDLVVSGITVNRGQAHGIHIHEFGDISSNDGVSAGVHFNPDKLSHGCPPDKIRHVGDTGNWNVSLDGTIIEKRELHKLKLMGPHSLIGRALIIHSGTDDCKNETSAGQRIAQCVIGIGNPAFYHHSHNKASAYKGSDKAVCVLQPTVFGTNITGIVLFELQDDGAVLVKAKVEGLVGKSLHGFHIHEFGDIRDRVGFSTGEHWNPFKSHHAIPPLNPRHLGDMGNIYYYDGATAYYMNTFRLFGLSGNVRNAIGHAVVIHSTGDDCSEPSGGSGLRIAHCVIGYANPSTSLALKDSVPTKQDTSACRK